MKKFLLLFALQYLFQIVVLQGLLISRSGVYQTGQFEGKYY
jgi:hypothetical protein